MKSKLFYGFGVALGNALYQIVADGFSHVDWYKVIFLGIFVFCFTYIFPSITKATQSKHKN